jgi:hypothetical protein
MGAHQQIDRVARRRLDELFESPVFPSFREIVRFEGKNGPDGIKVKSPARNEPWHYLQPLEDDNKEYLRIISNHYSLLVENLKQANRERAAFEAAWLAHAVVDGMTPAHHFPYEAVIEELRGGKGKESRNTYSEKLLFKGDTVSKTIGNMYKVYGPRGLFTAHHVFEFGVMLLLRPLRLPDARPSRRDMQTIATIGPEQYFINSAREVAALDLYEEYLKKGWTSVLSNKIRHNLAPTIVKTVTLLWYQAAKEAGICE